MAMKKFVFDFSANGEYLAYASTDGCLKIWETSTNILKQEFTPSSHLSATFSSIRWGPCKQTAHPQKKVKKSKDGPIEAAVTDLQLIGIGTRNGQILLYSFTNAELHSRLSRGHSKAVNDISWHTEDNSLFSCSNDLHITIWNISEGKIKTKWKADSNPILSICVIDNNNVLSCSNTISWWNIKEKTVIKTFPGHATEISRLLIVNSENSGSYLLSAAVGDRVINVWHLNEDSKRSVASFVLPDEPHCLDVVSRNNNKPFILYAVSKDGSLHIFKHMLNGRLKRPLQPQITVRIASKVDRFSKPRPIPILAADINEDINSCLLVYGTFLRPFFEKIDLSETSKNVFLVRDTSLATTSSSIEENVLKIKQADKSSKFKLLAPGHMMTDQTSHIASKKRKKKEKEIDIKELPVEERIRALDLSKNPASLEESESSVTSDSMLHLLLQGLQSKDNNMLNTVLQCGDESVIHNTVKNLPLQSIFLLLRELHNRINKQESRTHPCLRWMKKLLALHLPYLMSCKDVDEYLGPISQSIDARVQNFSKMCQLRGCLKILLSQVSSDDLTTDKTSGPLLTYQSESSEESEIEEIDLNENMSDNEVLEKSATDESDSSDSEDSMNI